MTLKEFLKKHPEINAAGLASIMWPGVRRPGNKITQKLNEYKAGTGQQRITIEDSRRAKEVLLAMLEDVKCIDL